MESLANLECFVRSAEAGSFSAAARQLALTPAAVSRNVAALERNLGARLFHRSTRKLTLTEAGERFLHAVDDPLNGIQAAIADMASQGGEPVGTLRVSVSATFGVDHILPLLPSFVARYPKVRVDWRFENRDVDLVADGIDVAIGDAIEPSPSVVARPLAPAHLIAVAAPAYMEGRTAPSDPSELTGLDGIALRSGSTGRVRHWEMRDAAGRSVPAPLSEKILFDDPAAMRQAAVHGLGVTLLTVPDALPLLESGALVRLVPDWYADAGAISLYYSSRGLLPAKTRAFVSHVVEGFKHERLAAWFAGSLGPFGARAA